MIAVVGAGPAGLAAAAVLREAGRDVVVLEASDAPGGRTKTVEVSPGHRFATGASWIPTFYDRTRAYIEGLDLLEQFERTLPELSVDGHRGPAPFNPLAAARSPLLPVRERVRLGMWFARLAVSRPPRPGRPASTTRDDIDAFSYLSARIGPAAVEYVFRPAFEPRSAIELAETSASLVRSWSNAAKLARFYTPAEGMDAPWRRLADDLDVRYGVEVTSVTADHVEPFGPIEAAVVAVPAPRAAALIAPDTPGRPDWLDDVRYSAHVAIAADRRTDRQLRTALHPAGPGPHRLGSVSIAAGGPRSWLPEGWERGSVSAHGAWSQELLAAHAADDDSLAAELWSEGRNLEPQLFPLDDAEVTFIRRQPHAVPIFGPGHATRLRQWQPAGPLALAGDWSRDPSVEGAVTSGERAARALLGTVVTRQPSHRPGVGGHCRRAMATRLV